MRKKDFLAERLELAKRLREIRMDMDYTQEKFAEILGISLTAYKKIESAENQITVNGLRILERELNISADYLIFGKPSDFNETWKLVQNCSENDKMHMFLRLYSYFSHGKNEKYLNKDYLTEIDEKIAKMKE